VAPSTDLVGYGKWGDVTYQTLWNEQPGYCMWTMNKFEELCKEGDEVATDYAVGDSKMKRLAQWIKESETSRAAIDPEFECDSDMELVEVEKPDDKKTLAERIAKLQADVSAKFYGVASPEDHKGVYTSWTECKPHVIGIKGVMYKSFASQEEALEYVQNPPPRVVKEETEESKAARAAKEEAKAAKVAEAKAAREQAKETKAAKDAEAKAAKEEAKAAKAVITNAAKAAKEGAKVAKAAEALKKREGAGTKKRSSDDAIASDAAGGEAAAVSETVASSAVDAPKAKRGRKTATGGDVPKVLAAEESVKAVDEAVKKSKGTKMREAAGKAHAKAKANAKAMATVAKAAEKATDKAKTTAKATVAKATEKSKGKAKATATATVAASNAAPASTTLSEERPKKVRRVKEPDAPTNKKDTVVPNTTKASVSPLISAEVLKRAEAAGMATALRNLSSRIEIMNLGLSSEKLLDALLNAGGLVNKAKGGLLSPTTDPITPAKDVSVAPAEPSPVSAEKLQKEKQQEQQANDELAKELNNLSATLGLVSTPAVKQVVPMEAGTQSNLTDAQAQRIKENRERALARRAQNVGA